MVIVVFDATHEIQSSIVFATLIILRVFLPPFNEGRLTILASTPPGTALAQSDTLAAQLEEAMLEQPEVIGTRIRVTAGPGLKRRRVESVPGIPKQEPQQAPAALIALPSRIRRESP